MGGAGGPNRPHGPRPPLAFIAPGAESEEARPVPGRAGDGSRDNGEGGVDVLVADIAARHHRDGVLLAPKLECARSGAHSDALFALKRQSFRDNLMVGSRPTRLRNHPNAPAYFGRIIRCWRDLLAWKCCQQVGSKPTQTGPNPSRAANQHGLCIVSSGVWGNPQTDFRPELEGGGPGRRWIRSCVRLKSARCQPDAVACGAVEIDPAGEMDSRNTIQREA
jgi:hypothetical protein